jgi:electron transfer flavoprotein alpha subunit
VKAIKEIRRSALKLDYIVLVKSVPDVAKGVPDYAMNKETGILERSRLKSILNPYDANALEFVLQMRGYRREKYNDCGRAIVLSMGPEKTKGMLKEILKYDVEEAVHLCDKRFAGADTYATSYALAQAIKNVQKEYSLDEYVVVCGKQSLDGDTAQVPPQIAEELGIPLICYAIDFRFDGDKLEIDREGPSSIETVTPLSYPCLLTVTNSKKLRLPTMKGILQADRKNVVTLGVDDVDCDIGRLGLEGSKTRVVKVYTPKINKKECCYVNQGIDFDDFVIQIKDRFNDNSTKVNPQKKQISYNKDTSCQGDVCVFVEQNQGRIEPVSIELMGNGKKLADSLGVKLCAVLLGHDVKYIGQKLIEAGADIVYLAENKIFKQYKSKPYAKALSDFVESYSPQIMLFGATIIGRELAPRVSYATKSGLTADCTELKIDDYHGKGFTLKGILVQTRPALGGNVIANIISTNNSKCQMATVRPGVMDKPNLNLSRQGEIINYVPKVEDGAIDISIFDVRPGQEKPIDLDSAKVVVCGGRGLGSREGFEKYVSPLVEVLKSYLGIDDVAMASTRAVTDSGWLKADYQVGQTGKTIKPKLYIGIGVSGAIQHKEGMKKADTIVVINNDINAPMFQVADYGFVGDFKEIVPQIINGFRNGR